MEHQCTQHDNLIETIIELKNSLKNISDKLDMINNNLIGTYTTKGLITKVDEIDTRLSKVESTIDKTKSKVWDLILKIAGGLAIGGLSLDKILDLLK